MPSTAILQPPMVLAGLTLVVAIVMFLRRSADLRRTATSINALPSIRANPASQWSVRTQATADNFQNLLELPLVFYFLTLTLHVTQNASDVVIALSWAYVAARVIHSAIHLTYNLISHRFAAYALSVLILTVLAILAAVKVF